MPHTLKTQPRTTVGEEWISPLAGKPAPKEMLIDVERMEKEYYERKPDVSDPNQLVSFGTSGHRGSPLRGTFNEAHILAIIQAICEYRRWQAIDGPLYYGKGHSCSFYPGTADSSMARSETSCVGSSKCL